MIMVITATVLAQQTTTLDTFRQAYEKQHVALLAQYGKTLDAIMAGLKKKGDLDNVLILQAEKKRFDAEHTVPAPKDAKDSFRPATEEYCRTLVTLLGQYVKALDGLVKKEVAADRIEAAKVIKTEKDKADFMLADSQAKLPVIQAVEKSATEKPEAAPKPDQLTTRPAVKRSSAHIRAIGGGKGRAWSIGSKDDSDREFDPNVRNAPETVSFELGNPVARFPNTLGADIGKQRSVINILFDSDMLKKSSLLIVWSAGGSDSADQFHVELDGVLVGDSSERKGEASRKWKPDSFVMPEMAAGAHKLTLTHLKGDGLLFDYIALVF